jgi:hypothetical protein
VLDNAQRLAHLKRAEVAFMNACATPSIAQTDCESSKHCCPQQREDNKEKTAP